LKVTRRYEEKIVVSIFRVEDQSSGFFLRLAGLFLELLFEDVMMHSSETSVTSAGLHAVICQVRYGDGSLFPIHGTMLCL
jgi:hypothetical protein